MVWPLEEFQVRGNRYFCPCASTISFASRCEIHTLSHYHLLKCPPLKTLVRPGINFCLGIGTQVDSSEYVCERTQDALWDTFEIRSLRPH